MAGLKQSILDDQPISFWTFDYDRNLINGDMILDEIGNQNPMVCQNDINGANYELEQQSLNEIEHADQYALAIAKNQKVNDLWLHQFFEVTHTSAYDFPFNGQFALEFLYYKSTADVIRNYGEVGYVSTITTPLFTKGSIINVYVQDGYYGGASSNILNVTVLGRSIQVSEAQYPVFNRVNHVVVNYRVVQKDVNEYDSILELWVNGRLYGTDTKTHVDILPVTATSASWLIGGTGGTNPISDFATELLKLDQIAVYNQPLTHQQVANHYRKTKQYDQMIKDDYPLRYWRLDELHDPNDTTVQPQVGGIDGRYHGAVNRYSPGPEKLVTAHSPYFQVGGLAYIDHYTTHNGQLYPVIDTSGSFTLEFWFRSKTASRGMLFDCSEEMPPQWAGLRVWLNSKNNRHSTGNVQVSHTHDRYVNSMDTDLNGERVNFNDDRWHHLVIRFTDGTGRFELWLDGVLHGVTVISNYATDRPAQITLMNTRPGDEPIEGYLCELAFYTYALADMQIYNRWVFTTRYKVAGYTLLQGAPVQARVRFFDTITGEFRHEVISNGLTGEYIYHPHNNRYVDVMSTLVDSSTTRYRVHGPVKPAEYDDSHLR